MDGDGRAAIGSRAGAGLGARLGEARPGGAPLRPRGRSAPGGGPGPGGGSAGTRDDGPPLGPGTGSSAAAARAGPRLSHPPGATAAEFRVRGNAAERSLGSSASRGAHLAGSGAHGPHTRCSARRTGPAPHAQAEARCRSPALRRQLPAQPHVLSARRQASARSRFQSSTVEMSLQCSLTARWNKPRH